MPDLKLIKNPGYVYDLIFIFYCKYNLEVFPEKFESSEDDMRYHSENLGLFEPISDDLYIFFKLTNHKTCFLTTNYFTPYRKLYTTEYDLAFLQKEISDHTAFIRNVINYYFDDLDDNEADECMRSNKYLFDVIKRSDYDDKLKTKLYEFFIDPERYIHLLQYELMAKDVQLSSYYEKNYSKVLDTYNELSCELLDERFEFLGHDARNKMNRSNVYVSFCLLNKNLLQFSYLPESTLYLLGIDYPSSIKHLRKKRIDLIPEQFGSALSDITRIKMLEIILQRGECTCKELGAELELPASTAYHHVNTLEKCALVKTRILKKSTLYSIDRKYFSAIIEYFKKFAESPENKK